jgi:hypothetical protein
VNGMDEVRTFCLFFIRFSPGPYSSLSWPWGYIIHILALLSLRKCNLQFNLDTMRRLFYLIIGLAMDKVMAIL